MALTPSKNLIVVACLLAATGPTQAGPSPTGGSRPPPGYRLVFSETFSDPGTIGLRSTPNGRANWFRSQFFGFPDTPTSGARIANGHLLLKAERDGWVQVSTASPVDAPPGWAGRAFRGGAFIAMRIAIGPDTDAREKGWPVVWTMSAEHLAQRGEARWPGQPMGVERFAENDLFEYNSPWWNGRAATTMQEWYGRWEQCARDSWCHHLTEDDPKRLAPFPDDGSFHIISQLWVAARNGADGYTQTYLDGVPFGSRTSWEAGDPAALPAKGRQRYNVMDRQGMVLILTGGAQSLTVDWVKVWQLPPGSVDRGG